MNFNKTTIADHNDYLLEKITGKITCDRSSNAKTLPFIGFLFSASLESIKVRLVYENPPKTTSNHYFAAATNRIAAINAGFFVISTKTPLDYCVIQGEKLSILRNYTRPLLVLNADKPKIVPNPLSFSDEFSKISILQAGPLLLSKNQINYDYSDYKKNAIEFNSDISADRHPRSVFGISDSNIHLLVIDGRSPKSAGLFLEESAELCQELGFSDAINLDGGASSTLIVQGKRINHPRFSFFHNSRYFSAPVPFGERKVPTVLIIETYK